jgi:hypothetical protein
LTARAYGLALAFVPALAAVADARGESFYSRADVLLSTTGEVSFHRAYTKRLDLPSPDCEAGSFKCDADRIYGQVYLLSFVEETTRRGEEGGATIERRDRGRLAIALDLPRDAEDAFEAALRLHLDGLGAPQFVRPRAGMGFRELPLEQRVLSQSAAPAWVCAELDGAYTFDLIVRRPQSDHTYARSGDEARKACRTLEAALEDVPPTIHRTIPDVREQVRQEVRLESFSSLEGLTWANRLAALPEGATFEKKRLAKGRKTGRMRQLEGDAFVGHEGRYAGVECDVRLPRASLELTGAPMWITRWTFAATRERFGRDPRRAGESRGIVLLALVPIADPLMDELEAARSDLTVPEEALMAVVTNRFERSASLDGSLVADALNDPTAWPQRGSWMIVICRDDGPARYGIAPFADAAEVANPREACAAIRGQIGN